MTKIVNSAAANTIFDLSGNPINNTTVKPKTLAGAAAGLGNNTELLDNASTFEVEATGTGSNLAELTNNIIGIEVDNNITNSKKSNSSTKVRTTKVATALRNNKWNPFSANWDNGYPTTSDDSSATQITEDNADDQNRITIGDGIVPDQYVK